mgnify:CR=1 FL=1
MGKKKEPKLKFLTEEEQNLQPTSLQLLVAYREMIKCIPIGFLLGRIFC